ncbi:cell division protein DivIB [Oenococcus sp. UCMA 16435]|nr:cell division protein DivIB [Oenococcus sp. UCMA 16435]MDI4584914.1 cell division protein DivIB [Oenococcus sp. UCMA 14587]
MSVSKKQRNKNNSKRPMVHFSSNEERPAYTSNNPVFNKIGLFFTAAVLLALFLQILFFLRPWQDIKETKVYTFQMDYRQVLKKLDLKVGDPYWQWAGQGQTINRKIENDSMIRSVSLELSKNGTAIIHVNENLTAGFVQIKQKWYRMNQNAQLSSKSIQPDGKTPVYTDFKSGSKILKKTITAYLSMDKVMRLAVAQIIYSPIKSSPNRLALVMNDGNLVYANPSSLSNRMDLYPKMVATMKEKGIANGVIDLQYGGYARKFETSDDNLVSSLNSKKSKSSSKSSSSSK